MTYVLYAPSSDKTGYFRLIHGVIYHKGSAYLKEQNPFFRGLLTLTHAWLKVNTSSKSSLCMYCREDTLLPSFIRLANTEQDEWK